MAIRRVAHRILVISKVPKIVEFLKSVLPFEMTRDMIYVTNVGEAKRMLAGAMFDIIVINTPLEEDFGIQSAIDISEQHSVGILLLVKNDMFEQVAYKVEEYGILTLPKQTTKEAVYMAIRMLGAMQSKMKRMAEETSKIKNKMNELRLVDRAKWILIDQLKMTEPEAHRYIEKQAMDRCLKRGEIAENIIKTYDR